MDKSGAARMAAMNSKKNKKRRSRRDLSLDDGHGPLTANSRHSTLYTDQDGRKTGRPCFWRFKRTLRNVYNARDVQVLIAVAIFINFLANCVRYSYPDDMAMENVMFYVELAFTIFFTIELLINMYSHWFSQFAASGWNWFDFVVVIISIMSIIPGSTLPGMTPMRLIRAFRVFKLFRSIKPMRKIIRALEEGLSGVFYAFMLLTLVISLYAILGVEFFRHLGTPCRSKNGGEQDGTWEEICVTARDEETCMQLGGFTCFDEAYEDIGEDYGTQAVCEADEYSWEMPCQWAFTAELEESYFVRQQHFWDHVPSGLRDSYDTAYFGTFWEALYTLFQVMLGDSWNEAIGRKVAAAYPITGPIYFISYILVATIMLLNVSVAVLLEKLFTVSQEMEDNEDFPFKLQIRVNHAQELPKMDLISDGDPYVKVTCEFYEEPDQPGKEKKAHDHDNPPVETVQVFQTAVQKNTRGPQWNTKFVAQGNDHIATVKFELYDWENWCKVHICGDDHDFIGEATLELTEEDFERCERIHKELDIRLPDDPESYRGTLSVDLLPSKENDDHDELMGEFKKILSKLTTMEDKIERLEGRLQQGEESNTTMPMGSRGGRVALTARRLDTVTDKGSTYYESLKAPTDSEGTPRALPGARFPGP